MLTGLRQDAQDVPAGFYRTVGERMRRERAFLERALQRGEYLVPMLTVELEEARMPWLLHYLALIESGYRPDVKSKAGARGLWQFMPATGREYGLKVDSKADERLNPEKSTYAAARYLKRLYLRFGDWVPDGAGLLSATLLLVAFVRRKRRAGGALAGSG